HQARVTDVRPVGGQFELSAAGDGDNSVLADHVLFVTGHSSNRPPPGSSEREFAEYSARAPRARYVPYAYPLENILRDSVAGPDRVVGCVGLGLTAFDVILYLTQGRGGAFVSDGGSGRLRYESSGREPQKIVGMSRSGLFTSARPYNAKQVNLSAYEHRGRF